MNCKRAHIFTFLLLLTLSAPLFADAAKDAAELIDNRQYDNAIELLTKKIKSDPNYADLHFQLGRAYFHKEKIEEALVEIEECLNQKRKHEEAKYYKARIFIILENWKDAKKIIDDGIKKSKKNKGLFYNAEGLYALAQKDFMQADVSFRKALFEEPDNLEYMLNQADVNFENENFGSAVIGYEKVLEIDSLNADASYRLGKAMYMQRQFIESAQILSKTIALDSNYTKAYRTSANVFMILGLSARQSNGNDLENGNGSSNKGDDHFKSAVWMFNKYLEKGGEEDAEVADRLGQAYYYVNAYEAAIEHLDKAITLGSLKQTVYNYKAKSYFRLKEYDKAVQAFADYENLLSGGDSSFEWQKEHFDFFKEKAQTYYQLYTDSKKDGEPDSSYLEKAIPAYIQAITLKEEEPDSRLWTQLGKCYHSLKQFNEAIPWFEKRAEVDSTHYTSYYYIALCYLGLKEYQSGVDNLIKVTEIKPDLAGAYKLIANVTLHQLKDRSGGVDRYHEWIAVDSTNYEPYKWLGYVNISAKPPQKDSAVRNLSKAISLMRANGVDICKEIDIIVWLAQAYNMYDDSDKEEQALKWAKTGLKCDPNNKVLQEIKRDLE